jgi:DNA polymerase/3'-5' exonuclease PolX
LRYTRAKFKQNLISIGTILIELKMENKVKSGKEVLDEFFNELSELPNVDKGISNILTDLYKTGKLSDVNIKNSLLKLREENGSKA